MRELLHIVKRQAHGNEFRHTDTGRVFQYKDVIVVLYHLPKSTETSYREYLAGQLHPVFRSFANIHMQVYVSKPFYTIADFSDAYRQAENTCQIVAAAPDPMKSKEFSQKNTGLPFASSDTLAGLIFFFEDYWIQDLIFQNPVKKKSLFYCEPCLIEMLKTDTKKSRQQLRILYEYLNCDRNFTDVAKKLSMHRNNIIYHIKNLEEAYHLNLDDAEVRLKLLLSFELLKAEALLLT